MFDKGNAGTGTEQVHSVVKALAILETFSPQQTEQSVTQISSSLGLPRPTVSRLVGTLVGCGYLQKNINQKYSLGMKLFHLGSIVHSTMELCQVTAPLLHELRDRFQETTYMDIIDGKERLCIFSLEGYREVRAVVPVGQRSPLHAGADGRVLLAGLEQLEIEKLLDETGLPSFTENTINDRKHLMEVLAEIRREGVAVSCQEFVRGSVSIAAPVCDRTGKVVAGVAISLPVFRAEKSQLEQYKEAVKQTARAASLKLGCTF